MENCPGSDYDHQRLNCHCCYPELQPRGRRKRFQSHLLMDDQSSTPLTSHTSPNTSVSLSHHHDGLVPLEHDPPLSEYSRAMQPLRNNISIESGGVEPAFEHHDIDSDAARSSTSSESTIVVGLQDCTYSGSSPYSIADDYEDGGIFSLQNDMDSWLQMPCADFAFDFTLSEVDHNTKLTGVKDAPQQQGATPCFSSVGSHAQPWELEIHAQVLQDGGEVSQAEGFASSE